MQDMQITKNECECSICQVDLKAPEFRDHHRKVLTVGQAPEFICGLCEHDLLEIGVLDMDALRDPSQSNGMEILGKDATEGHDLTFQGNQRLHGLIREIANNPDKYRKMLPAIGRYA